MFHYKQCLQIHGSSASITTLPSTRPIEAIIFLFLALMEHSLGLYKLADHISGLLSVFMIFTSRLRYLAQGLAASIQTLVHIVPAAAAKQVVLTF